MSKVFDDFSWKGSTPSIFPSDVDRHAHHNTAVDFYQHSFVYSKRLLYSPKGTNPKRHGELLNIPTIY